MASDETVAVEDFEQHRRHLTGLGYRMLGSLAEAEDLVQEAYLRWHAADHSAIEDSRAYLSRIMTRLCLDHLKSARVRREKYIGPWLPEPVLDDAALAVDAQSELADDLSVALLLALERLSPLERAAFLLHDVFDVEFTRVAEVLERSESTCRQLAARARTHVQDSRPRFTVSGEDCTRIAEAFMTATRTGDAHALTRLLAEDAVLHSDGGGKRPAALRPIDGRDKIVRFFVGVSGKADLTGAYVYTLSRLNGQPGYVVAEPDGSLTSVTLDLRDGLVTSIYIMRNPDKLGHLSKSSGEPT
jgi:RNA polymerase sigma-70 factor (ECF subfamily)